MDSASASASIYLQIRRRDAIRQRRVDELQPIEILNTESNPLSSAEACSIPNVQSQITVESVDSHQGIKHFSRLDFINSQLKNCYLISNLPPCGSHRIQI